MVTRALILVSLLLTTPRPSLAPPQIVSEPSSRSRGGTLMVASWYGPRHHGHRTASGVIFDQYAMTCAHRTLPFGTRLRLSVAGRVCIVTTIDRGPFRAGRDLDVSYAAAKALGMIEHGVAIVSAEVL